MKIKFVLPYAGMAGGIKVVAIYAAMLAERGHDVHVISVKRPKNIFSRFTNSRYCFWESTFWYSDQGPSHLSAIKDGCWTILNHKGPITDDDLGECDVVIATWWKTAEWVSRLAQKNLKKFYFCQGFETHHISNKGRVEATYSLPLTKICVSNWVRESIRSLTGKTDQLVVPNGVDTVQFYSGPRVKSGEPKFGFLYSPSHWKGTDIVLKALKLAKQINPAITAVCFGTVKPYGRNDFPSWIQIHQNPSQDFIRNIYGSCDGWLFGSRAEGFGLPILEAMACRTPVVATPAGAAIDIIVDHNNGLLVEHDNPEAMSMKILQVANMNASDWGMMSESAYITARKHTWEESVDNFERILSGQ